jgi:hypothetical protein
VLFVGTCVVLVPTSVANATPLTITESTDFSNTAPGGTIGPLDVGVNTIVGHVVAADNDYADYFVLTLPAFTTLVGFELSIDNFQTFNITNGTVTATGIPAFGTLQVQAVGGGFFFGVTNFSNGGTGGGPATLVGPASLTAEFLYDPQDAFPLPPGFIAIGGGYDYQVTYTVAATATAVPEPATLSLFGLGLGMLTARRGKRTRN